MIIAYIASYLALAGITYLIFHRMDSKSPYEDRSAVNVVLAAGIWPVAWTMFAIFLAAAIIKHKGDPS